MSIRNSVMAALAAALLLLSSARAQGVYPFPETAPDLRFEVAGVVNVIVPLQIGGQPHYLIGGQFDRVDGAAQDNLALLDGNGNLAFADPAADWAHGTDGPVHAIALDGDSVVVGGDFYAAGGAARKHLARFFVTSGSLDPAFQPAPDGAVHALAVDGLGHVYVGGQFAAIDAGGVTLARDRAAKLQLATGAVIAGWVPGYAAADMIQALHYDDAGSANATNHRLYVGGAIKVTSGQNRAITRLLPSSGAHDGSWSASVRPRGGASVRSIVSDAQHVYFAGVFRSVGTNSNNRRNIARVLKSNGALDGWNPDADGAVNALAFSTDGDVLAAGEFLRIGGHDRSRLALLDRQTGVARVAFIANADRNVTALAIEAGHALVGGRFGVINGAARAGVGRIDAISGTADVTFDASVGGQGAPLAVVKDALGGYLIGGSFDAVRVAGSAIGEPRSNLVRLRADFSIDPAWQADTRGDVLALAVDGNTLYVGGRFDQAAAQPRTRLARFMLDPKSAAPTLDTGWNTPANAEVTLLVADPSGVHVAGEFSQLGAAVRNHVGRLDVGGAVTGWNPNPDDQVGALLVSGTSVVLGGSFTSIGPAARAGLARVDALTGAVLGGFDIGVDATVAALALDGSMLLVGGDFAEIGGEPIARLARIDLGSNELDIGWAPLAGGNGTVSALALTQGKLYVGGHFSDAGGLPRANLARVTAAGLVDPGWRPGTDGAVTQLQVLDAGGVLANGAFWSVTGAARNGLAHISANDSTVTSITLTAPASLVIGTTAQVTLTTSQIPDGAHVAITGASGCEIEIYDNFGGCELTFDTLGNVELNAVFADGITLLGAQDSTSVQVIKHPTSIMWSVQPLDPVVDSPVQLALSTAGIADASHVSISGAPGCEAITIVDHGGTCTTLFAEAGDAILSAHFAGTPSHDAAFEERVITIGRMATSVHVSATPSVVGVQTPVRLDLTTSGIPQGAIVAIDGAPGCSSIQISSDAGHCMTAFASEGNATVLAVFAETSSRLASQHSVQIAVDAAGAGVIDADLSVSMRVLNSRYFVTAELELVEFSVLAENAGPADVALAPFVASVDADAFEILEWSCAPAERCSSGSGTDDPIGLLLTLDAGASAQIRLLTERREGAAATAQAVAAISAAMDRIDPNPDNNDAAIAYQRCRANILIGPTPITLELLVHDCVFRDGFETVAP